MPILNILTSNLIPLQNTSTQIHRTSTQVGSIWHKYTLINFSGEHNFNSNEGNEIDSRVVQIIVHPRYARLNYDIGKFHEHKLSNLKI
jgi:hypothetical protein